MTEEVKLFLDPRLLEALAEFEHEQFKLWSENLLKSEPGLSEERKANWAKLVSTPYAELPEEIKAINREWAEGAGKIMLGALLNGMFAATPKHVKDERTL